MCGVQAPLNGFQGVPNVIDVIPLHVLGVRFRGAADLAEPVEPQPTLGFYCSLPL